MARHHKSRTPRTGKHVDYSSMPKTLREEDLQGILEKVKTPFLLVLDRIQDPHNLGACLRTADAAGVHAVIAPKNRAVSLTDTVRRIAAGAAEHVPFVQVTNLARTLRALHEEGIQIIGTADEATNTLYDVDLTGPLAFVLGFEGTGVRRLTHEQCDESVRIPMHGSVECLNVSVATGVCLFEARRQRNQARSK